MKKFCKFDTIDVENPLRIFIAGAKFRRKNPGLSDNNALAISHII